MDVSQVSKDLLDFLPIYQLIDDVMSGPHRILRSSRLESYIPKFECEDPSDVTVVRQNEERYRKYIEKAQLYNVTEKTLEYLIGQIYFEETEIKLPSILDPFLKNVNGAGLDIYQFSKRLASFVLPLGRSGILADFPNIEGALYKEKMIKNHIYPTLTIYHPSNITMWWEEVNHGQTKLSLVVLKENHVVRKGTFELEPTTVYRVLYMDQGRYTMELFYENDSTETRDPNEKWVSGGKKVILGYNGLPLEEIPFTFVGAINNDSVIDKPPFYNLAHINIGHYRNSADYEEVLYMLGQPTPIITGLDEDWVRDNPVLKLGSRKAIPLPKDATANLLQTQANTMIFEAMAAKEKQMVTLGGKIVEQQQIRRTATQSGIDHIAEQSALNTSLTNMSTAIQLSLTRAYGFLGDISKEDIRFKMKTYSTVMQEKEEKEKAEDRKNKQEGKSESQENNDNGKKTDQQTKQ